MLIWKRLLRTPSSERFLGTKNGKDSVVIDLHHLDNAVAGTVVLFADAGFQEDDVPQILASFDEDMLPGVDLASGTLTFTVVRGEIWGNFEAASDDAK